MKPDFTEALIPQPQPVKDAATLAREVMEAALLCIEEGNISRAAVLLQSALGNAMRR
jgi:hypothetical protein